MHTKNYKNHQTFPLQKWDFRVWNFDRQTFCWKDADSECRCSMSLISNSLTLRRNNPNLETIIKREHNIYYNSRGKQPFAGDYCRLLPSPSISQIIAKVASQTDCGWLSSTQFGLQVLWSSHVGFYDSDPCLLPCSQGSVNSLLASSEIHLWIWIPALLFQASCNRKK